MGTIVVDNFDLKTGIRTLTKDAAILEEIVHDKVQPTCKKEFRELPKTRRLQVLHLEGLAITCKLNLHLILQHWQKKLQNYCNEQLCPKVLVNIFRNTMPN